ncbi:MAG: HTH domain-containing protein [Sandaracinaceae bacterium]|nr:HTH domain-containing protein [Sandaracinaceae bacterium]
MTTKSSPGRRKGAYTQATRVLAILELVRREAAPVPLARIAAQFELSERQARRDVAMLAESGHARSVIVEGRSAVAAAGPEPVSLTPRERVLLGSLGVLAAQLGGGAVGEELRAALHKLALSAREEREHPATLVAAPVPPASASVGERIDRIEQAIRARHELRVRLASEREEPRALAFLPYLLVMHPSGPHVVGRWDVTEPIRAVPLEKLSHVEVVSGTVVAAPQSLDLGRLFERSLEAPRASSPRLVHS